LLFLVVVSLVVVPLLLLLPIVVVVAAAILDSVILHLLQLFLCVEVGVLLLVVFGPLLFMALDFFAQQILLF